MKKNEEPVIVEQTFNTSIENVWTAITELEQMHQWYFDNIPAFKPEVGFKTQFIIENEGRSFTHKWEITEVVPQKKITCDWTFDEYEGQGLVIFELFGEGAATRFKLTNLVLQDFPNEVPEFKRESCLGGWNYFINQKLKEYLENR